MEEMYRLSPKIKLMWLLQYILAILILWVILMAVYTAFFSDIHFLIFTPELPIFVGYFIILLILIIVLGAPAYLWADVAYRNFTYALGENGVLIRMGVLHKRRIDLPYSSIENVSVERPLSERIFGLGTIVLDTAGGDEKEGVIPGIADTETVMNQILERIHKAKGKTEAKEV